MCSTLRALSLEVGIGMDWFNVDKKGLAKLLERKGKEFVLMELIQNAWDENTSTVIATLKRIPGTRYVSLVVADDNPDGFADLSHAFTLFAESSKKGQAEKRGRFNLGEKLTLALCEEAQILSTRGGVSFDENGRHTLRTKTERGSVFTGRLRMTTEELLECDRAAATLLPPDNVATFYNGFQIPSRTTVASFSAALATEIADAEGALRRSVRTTQVCILEPAAGETPMLYEMGIPVVATGDRWHVNVMQKVPLSLDRDNVPPAYLAKLRALVLQHTADRITTEDANAPWVREAVQKHAGELDDATINIVSALRFGDKRVAYDPSDREANQRAASEGYTVVHGAQMSANEWDAVRRAGAILPAGRVTPSPKPYSEDGSPLNEIAPAEWTDEIRAVVDYIQRVAPHLVGRSIVSVRIVSNVTWPFAGTYGPESGLTLNLGRLGHRWFAGPLREINDLLIHELGHHYCSNHLSSDYYDALTKLGAKLVELALAKPEMFNRELA